MRSVTLVAGRMQTSRLGFGTSSLHHLRSARKRASLLAHCYDVGVRHFDSAPLYGHELAERELGRFTCQHRSEIVVATKFGIEPDKMMAKSTALMYVGLAVRALASRIGVPRTHEWVRDYSPKGMLHSLERSLSNLRTNYVDLFFAHDPSLTSPGFSDELVRELERIRAAGKARFIGLSGNATDCVALATRYPQIADVLQIDVSTGPETVGRVRSAGLVPAVTFGHFRGAVRGSAKLGRSSIIRQRLELATAENPQGVILFSARSKERIDEVLTVLGHVDHDPAD
jgi:aryl-alcohol dehydrogenase-like predicted oxidoreductase